MLRRKRSTGSPPRRRRRIRKLRLFVLLALLGLAAVASFSFGMIRAIASQIPSCDPASTKRLEVDGHVYDSTGNRILATLRGSESRVLLPSDRIAPIMKQAIVAIEDRRFYQHRGVDLRGIARALWADVTRRGVVEGGSTITQQFVKNSCVDDRRTISRKLKEAALAWQLEQRWRKDRILTAYLNTIYFGNGAYGIQRAAQTYFGKNAIDLTLPEAALLAGIPADPTRFDPVANPRAARERRDLVLGAMVDLRDISAGTYRAASAAPLPRPADVGLPGIEGPAPFFVNYAKDQLIRKYGPRRVFGGGIDVRTTIDLHLQELARQAIGKVLTDPAGPSAALVSIRPQTGDVVAMYGGGNYRASQFNLAVQGERQPGSAFKPIVLATALKEGIAPSTVFPSRPVSIFIGDRYWRPRNYENAYLGSADLDTATVESDNSVYAQLTQVVGPANVARTARTLGITRPLNPYFAIGLGADPVSPLELARAFATFANGGARIDGSAFGDRPRAITRVEDSRGKTIDANRAVSHRVLAADRAAILTSILEHVVQSGTGRAAALADRPAAGKTGTTEKYGDAWFVGYTPDLVTAVWVGYPDSLRSMLTEFHGSPVAGGTFPAEIWREFTQAALAGTPAASFPPAPYLPATARRVTWRNGRLELDNGACRETYLLAYFGGTGPNRTAGCKPNEVQVPRVVGKTLAAAKEQLAAQPLTPQFVYKPARAGQRLDLVLDQFPRSGYASSYDDVTLVLAKALHGVVPRVVGLSVPAARARLRAAHLVAVLEGVGRVRSQSPRPGVAAQRGMPVRLVAARG